jgi:hypothetical protein
MEGDRIKVDRIDVASCGSVMVKVSTSSVSSSGAARESTPATAAKWSVSPTLTARMGHGEE